MKPIEIKQIIVVTDGKSNAGGSPITAAREALRNNIMVNAIGIVEQGENEDHLNEIIDIAKAGGGAWEHTSVSNLGYSMMAVTQRTVNKTIHSIVGKQLREIISGGIEDISPDRRGKVIRYMEELGEHAMVRCCIVIDCSGSMANKMSTAKQSIIELMNSFQGRNGNWKVAVIGFPGESGMLTKVIHPFTEDIKTIKGLLFELKAGGMTPTAAAIIQAKQLLESEDTVEIHQVISNSEPLIKKHMV